MIGTGELLVILCLILLLFGGKRLPELARSLGLGIREFKKACNGEDEGDEINYPKVEKKGREKVRADIEDHLTSHNDPEQKL